MEDELGHNDGDDVSLTELLKQQDILAIYRGGEDRGFGVMRGDPDRKCDEGTALLATRRTESGWRCTQGGDVHGYNR